MTNAQRGWAPQTSPPDPTRNRLLTANSAVALTLAAPIAITLHELAHAVAGLTLGARSILSSNSVSYVPDLTPDQQVITAAAGPLFSLLLGAVLFASVRNVGRGFFRLLLLWTSLLSLQNFAGYLVIAPFARAGDTGQVMALLGAPTVAYVLVSVLGAALTLLNSRLLAGQITRYGRSRQELKRLVLVPWLVATGFTVAHTALNAVILGLPAADVPVVMAGAFSVAIFAPMFTFFYRPLHPPYDELHLSSPVVPLVITVVVFVAVSAVLAPGLPLG